MDSIWLAVPFVLVLVMINLLRNPLPAFSRGFKGKVTNSSFKALPSLELEDVDLRLPAVVLSIVLVVVKRRRELAAPVL